MIEKNLFPIYDDSLVETQQMIIKELKEKGFNDTQLITGLIQGMANASFRLAVKLSFLLGAIMNNPDFDLTDEETIKLISKNLIN
jgi:UTP-glucose-1-phosphate uridylyltransferase